MSTITSDYDLSPLSTDLRQRLAEDLSRAERRILLDHGTERPFCSHLLDSKEPGVYTCRLCTLPLFLSDHKFDSGSGWPSFFAPYHGDHIAELADHSLGMLRSEIRCARCASHLGHVFPDGPPPSGQRYCINGLALQFVPAGQALPELVRD